MKKMLYIHMDFYEYEERIISAFTEHGYEVTPFFDKNHRTILSRIIQRVNKNSKYTARKNYNYQMNFLKTLTKSNKQFDIVMVIVGRYMSEDFIRGLKEMYSSAKFVLYLWDDLARVPNYLTNHKYYDEIFSMDKNDCKKYGFAFLPLFYTRDYVYQGEEKDVLLFSTGLDHSNRVDIIEEIIAEHKEDAKDMKFYIYSSPFLQLTRRLRRRDFSPRAYYINYKRMPLGETASLTKRSRCLLDVQYSTQNGLSLRTLECLAARAKIITTNESIKDYDFYCPQNIKIINRNRKIEIDMDFLNTPYKDVPTAIVQQYSIDNWSKALID